MKHASLATPAPYHIYLFIYPYVNLSVVDFNVGTFAVMYFHEVIWSCVCDSKNGIDLTDLAWPVGWVSEEFLCM